MKIKQFQGGFRFLSNFHPGHVALDNVRYDTVEHAFQAAKTLDSRERQQVRLAETPGKAKKLGRKVTLRDDWELIKIDVMEDFVRQKFTRHPDLKQQLLDTGDAEIEEGNTWRDTFWGVDLKTGQGENWLGKILMKVREELKGEDS
jgi:ribA/ribD-fused uncharacterized protein